MALSNASPITSGVNVTDCALCKRTTFLVFNLTADSTFVHSHVLVWWKLQVRWCYCVEYITISPILFFLNFKGSVATQLRCGMKEDNAFIENSLLDPNVKKIENRPTCGKVMNEKYHWSFLTHSVNRLPVFFKTAFMVRNSVQGVAPT